jgi:hypothetical protein
MQQLPQQALPHQQLLLPDQVAQLYQQPQSLFGIAPLSQQQQPTAVGVTQPQVCIIVDILNLDNSFLYVDE